MYDVSHIKFVCNIHSPSTRDYVPEIFEFCKDVNTGFYYIGDGITKLSELDPVFTQYPVVCTSNTLPISVGQTVYLIVNDCKLVSDKVKMIYDVGHGFFACTEKANKVYNIREDLNKQIFLDVRLAVVELKLRERR